MGTLVARSQTPGAGQPHVAYGVTEHASHQTLDGLEHAYFRELSLPPTQIIEAYRHWVRMPFSYIPGIADDGGFPVQFQLGTR